MPVREPSFADIGGRGEMMERAAFLKAFAQFIYERLIHAGIPAVFTNDELIEQKEYCVRIENHTVPVHGGPEYGGMVIDRQGTGTTFTVFIGQGGFADMQRRDADKRDMIDREVAARQLSRLADRLRG